MSDGVVGIHSGHVSVEPCTGLVALVVNHNVIHQPAVPHTGHAVCGKTKTDIKVGPVDDALRFEVNNHRGPRRDVT